MATVRNVAGDARWIPYVNAEVEDGATFEVDDKDFERMHFHPDLFKVVTPPVSGRSKPKPRKRVAKKAAAPKPDPTPPVVVDDVDPDHVGDAPNEVTE